NPGQRTEALRGQRATGVSGARQPPKESGDRRDRRDRRDRVIGKTTTRTRDRISSARNRKGRQGIKMQGQVHTGKTITDLSELLERAEGKAGCYASSNMNSEASADDPVVEYPIADDPMADEPIVKEMIGEDPIPKDPLTDHAIAKDPIIEDPTVAEFKDSCGADAAAGKASDGACVEGLGDRCPQGKDGDRSAMSSRSESQQNCAGLGAEGGIPP